MKIKNRYKNYEKLSRLRSKIIFPRNIINVIKMSYGLNKIGEKINKVGV
jgi:hypothetical protein